MDTMEKSAKQWLEDHKNPLVKLDLFGQRFFFKTEDADTVQLHCNKLEKALTHSRVDRRCARILGEWSTADDLTRVTKVAKGLLNHSGFQDKNGVFLYPEETLFLLETNKLEVGLDGIPLSIQDCYDLTLRSPGMSLARYIMYKKLRLHGFRLLRYSEWMRRKERFDVKRKLQCDDETKGDGVKKRYVEGGGSSFEADLLRKLQSEGPNEWCGGSNDVQSDYCVFLPANKSRVDYDFDLKICEGDVLGSFQQSKEKPIIYGVCCGDNISFYKLAGV